MWEKVLVVVVTEIAGVKEEERSKRKGKEK